MGAWVLSGRSMSVLCGAWVLSELVRFCFVHMTSHRFERNVPESRIYDEIDTRSAVLTPFTLANGFWFA